MLLRLGALLLAMTLLLALGLSIFNFFFLSVKRCESGVEGF